MSEKTQRVPLTRLAVAALLAVAAPALAEDGASREVDIGGHPIVCRVYGAGSPTIVFVSGASVRQTYWGEIPAAISARATAVTFDRPGVGDSEPGPPPRDAGRVARELRALLQAVDAPAPYVVVGHSIGTIFAHVFAGTYPDDVAGLILLDPGHKDMLDGFADTLAADERRTWDEFWRGVWISYEERADGVGREVQAVDASLAQQRASSLRADLPLLVVSALDPERASSFVAQLSPTTRQSYFAYLRRFHERLAALSTRGRRVTAEGSGHMIPVERPDLVVQFINEMLDAVAAASPRQ